jgi:hypothetical protein
MLWTNGEGKVFEKRQKKIVHCCGINSGLSTEISVNADRNNLLCRLSYFIYTFHPAKAGLIHRQKNFITSLWGEKRDLRIKESIEMTPNV